MRRLCLLVLLIACRAPAEGDDGDDTTPDVDAGIGCVATDPRTPPTESFVGPTGLLTRWEDFIDAADETLDVQMYLFTVDEVRTRIVAAHQRGVAVRVLLDPDQPGNTDTMAALAGAGVPVRDAPASFEFSHAKYLVADGARAMVMSANFNYGAISSERNYGAVIEDPDDIADLTAIFEADWDGGEPELDCTRLVVSPVNATSRLLGLIHDADDSLDLSVSYITDSNIRTAIIEAHDRGASVRVILADPAGYPENDTVATVLANRGVPVRFLETVDLHAKLVISDGVAAVGSQNLSPTSLGDNREVGVLVTEASAVAPIQAQLDSDWAAATPP